jgi:hypothetical protein
VGDEGTWRRVKTPSELAEEIALAIRAHELSHGLLGARMPAFQTPSQFFRPFEDQSKIFNHALPLVGRDEYLEQIAAFSRSTKRILLLPGRGGLGKSRVLKEGLTQIPGTAGHPRALLLRDVTSFDRSMANDLPVGAVTVAVDDAHRMRDLGTLLAVAREYSPRLQLILASRPYGIPLIRQSLAEARFTSDEIQELSELAPLSRSDTVKLAREVLPDELAHLAERLVHVSGDSPLVTVVGAQLLVRDQIDPDQLVNSDQAKREIFDRFQDVQLGALSEELDQNLARRIVELVSALGPLQLHHEALVERSAAFLGIEPHELRRALVVLEDAGALVESFNAYRVTPDVLSDYVLQKVCVLPSGESTGFASRIFDHFEGVGLDNLLVNLSDVEPEKVFEFIRSYVDTHDLEVPDVSLEEALRGYSTNPIRELPNILLALSADLRHLPRALDLLWLLGRDDTRPTNPDPDHPLRVLERIAEVEVGKDHRIYDEVLRAVARWTHDPDAFSHRYSPLDVLDMLLKRESIWTPGEWERSNSLEQGVAATSVTDVRRRGIRILADLARHSNPVVQHRALSSLLSAMWHPEELTVGGEEGAIREQENRLIADVIEELLATSASPLLAFTVEGTIRSMRPDCADERNHALCNLIALAPTDVDSRLVRHLRFGQRQLAFFEEEARQGIHEQHAAVVKDLTAVVQRMVDQEGTAPGIKSRLERELNELARYGVESRPDEVLRVLAAEHPLIAVEIAELVLADAESVLAPHLDHLLMPLRGIDTVAYRRIVEAALKTGNPVLVMSISHTLSRIEALEPWERIAIRTLAENQNPEFVRNTIRSIRSFPRDARDEAMAVIRAIDIGSNPDLAEDLVAVVVGYPRRITERIKDDVRDALLPKLVPVTRVADAGRATYDLLDRLAVQDPEHVVQFFLDRIRHGTELRREGNHHYDMVPTIRLSTAFDLNRADSQARHRALTRIANAMVSPPQGVDPYYLDDLYALMANGFDDLSIQVLDELVEREGRHGVRPALHLLRRAASQVVFDRAEFLSRLLEVANQAGPEELTNVHVSLFRIAWAPPELVHEAPSPPPTVHARDRGQEAANRQPEGSLARNFYEALVRESEIQMGFERRVRDELRS